ncbi:MAG: PHB depolymerase family esterase [Planctomycetota bacterium]|nr:PHB depolymerase family esterase [Planctomycetota bacterium]
MRVRLLAVLPLALLAVVLGPLAPTGTDVAHAATTETGSLLHQGRIRTYRVMLPKGHTKTKPAPLVLALHGGGGTAQAFDRQTNGQFGRETDKRGWVVVFPQGIAKGWNDGRKVNSRAARQRRGVNDVQFIAKLIDRIHARHGIDRSRVYATGISNGGFMSYRLALELSDRIAAIAPVTANLQKVHEAKRPAHPVGLLVINGTKDPLVPYDGGYVTALGTKRGAILSTDATIQRWVAFTGCKGEPTTTAIEDRAPNDRTKAKLTQYRTCRGAEVALCKVEGGGHTWPGGRQYLGVAMIGRVSRDFDAVPLMFDFFARHRRVPSKASSPPAAPAKPESPKSPSGGK